GHGRGREAEEAGERPQQHIDILDVDETLHLGDGHLGVGTVVLDEQLYLASQQAAPRVDLVDAELIAVAVLGAGYVELAGQGERGCEHDRLAVAFSTGCRVGGGGRVGATGRGARGSRG